VTRGLALRLGALSIVWFVLGLLMVAQQPPGTLRVERSIVTTGTGPQRLAVDMPLLGRAQRVGGIRSTGRWQASAEGGLGDLRIFDAQGREVPYLLVHPSKEPEWFAAERLPIASTKTTSGFEADLGAVQTIDMLLVEGLPAPFLKRFTLEGSGDREHWTMLVTEGTLFDLPQDGLQQLAVPFRAGAYRYLRLTWDDTNSGRVPVPPIIRARSVADDRTIYQPLTAGVPVERRASEPGQSRYRLLLPAAGLPIVAITLDVGPGHVFRHASVMEARFDRTEAAPVLLGRETLARIERDGVTAAALRIPIAPPRESELELVIEDGSNPPLDLRGARIECAELPWIYFEAPTGPLTARYGNPSSSAPVYDLEAVRRRISLAVVPEARWGEPREAGAAPAPPPPMPDTGAAVDAGTFAYQRRIATHRAGLSALTLDAAALAHSRGPAERFADVRISDGHGRQVPYLLERRDEPLVHVLTLRPASASTAGMKSEPGHSRSVYAVSLPYPRLPSPRLVLETSNRVFQRRVEVVREHPSDRRHRDAWAETLATGLWQHSREEVPAPALLLQLPPDDISNLFLVVDEGDNRPLEISRAQLLLPTWRLRFFASSESPVLLYGQSNLQPPRYDLALLAPQVMGAQARMVEAAPEESTTSQTSETIVSPRMFWVGLSVAVVALLAVIAKLVAGSSAVRPPPSAPAA
jgi:hypothetical protein